MQIERSEDQSPEPEHDGFDKDDNVQHFHQKLEITQSPAAIGAANFQRDLVHA